MAGLRGNTAWWMLAKQSAKGTAATPALLTTYKTPFTSGSLQPARTINQLAETDASRDQGVSFVSVAGVTGNPECYGRDSVMGALLTYCLGTDTASGTTPNYTHTITAANTIPYVTFWQDLSDTLWEQYTDCFVSALDIKASAGQPMTCQATILGLSATRLTTDPSLSPAIPLQSSYVYNYNDATVTLAGGAVAVVSSFELTIDNNVSSQQTDSFVPYDVVAGQRQISLSFDMIFADLTEYNKFHYGSSSGTTQSAALYTTSADFQYDNGANNQIKFTLPTIAYQEFPVSSNPNGDPITVSVRAVAQRPVSGSIMTAVVKDQIATY